MPIPLLPANPFTPPLLPPLLPPHPLITPAEPHTPRVHLIGIRICRCLCRRQCFRGSWPICIIIRPIQMRHLMQDTARLIIIIIRAGRSVLREVPVTVTRARHNCIVARYRVEQRAAVGAVAVDVGAVDLRGRSLHPFNVGVDGADFGFLGGGFEPDGEVISRGACCGVCSSRKGDSIRNAGFEGGGLGGGT